MKGPHNTGAEHYLVNAAKVSFWGGMALDVKCRTTFQAKVANRYSPASQILQLKMHRIVYQLYYRILFTVPVAINVVTAVLLLSPLPCNPIVPAPIGQHNLSHAKAFSVSHKTRPLSTFYWLCSIGSQAKFQTLHGLLLISETKFKDFPGVLKFKAMSRTALMSRLVREA